MVHYKLTYFPVRGAGECARQIFALAGQEFEDVRLTKEQFAPVKPNMPFGQLPVLEVDGKQLAQSLAICRYLARQFEMNDSKGDRKRVQATCPAASNAAYNHAYNHTLKSRLVGNENKRHQSISASTSDTDRFSGFAGKTPFDEAVVDSLADQYSDYRVEIKSYFYTAVGMMQGDKVSLQVPFTHSSRIVALTR
ncbi:glutathione S-transferase protein [Ancylostoma duodenale]|uniref:glutathione transferase n=1 Tax=Ancylostoma duodenale TaxID=51022 RepID=A0A0C2FV21_9BILA|nr:glutathione S-transferase protein [Ancylostoma duodenale]